MVFKSEIRQFPFCARPHSNTQLLFSVFQLADAALSAAGRAKKGKTSEATGAFQLVQEEIKRFGFPTPRDVDPDDYRKKLPDMSTALESASNRDEESTGVLSKVESAFKAPVSHLS